MSPGATVAGGLDRVRTNHVPTRPSCTLASVGRGAISSAGKVNLPWHHYTAAEHTGWRVTIILGLCPVNRDRHGVHAIFPINQIGLASSEMNRNKEKVFWVLFGSFREPTQLLVMRAFSLFSIDWPCAVVSTVTSQQDGPRMNAGRWKDIYAHTLWMFLYRSLVSEKGLNS